MTETPKQLDLLCVGALRSALLLEATVDGATTVLPLSVYATRTLINISNEHDDGTGIILVADVFAALFRT